jgi:molybdate/tungstate transport system substrate-binding protein
VPPSNQRLTLYRAGSLSAAFKPLLVAFTCQTGIQVTDVTGASVDKARQCTAGGQPCDLYASADSTNIDLFLKPAGYADFTIVFAQGRMVLGYSASGLAQKNLPPIADPNSGPFNPPVSIPKASANWYKILTSPGVAIGGGVPFLDPGAYRAFLIFQLAQQYYKSPMLYDDLMQHMVIPGGDHSVPALGRLYDFQFTYEHNARAMARKDPDFRYVDLPDEINLSDPARNAYYAKNSVVVLPGLGTPSSAQSIPVPGARVAWGITVLTNAPNRENAVKFLQLLLSPAGTASLKENGPAPISPANVTPEDFHKIPESLRPFVRIAGN